jgi:hypothetical protein
MEVRVLERRIYVCFPWNVEPFVNMEIWRSRIEKLEANTHYTLLSAYIHRISYSESVFISVLPEE